MKGGSKKNDKHFAKKEVQNKKVKDDIEEGPKPKKALSSYMIFSIENREKIKKDNPNLKNHELMGKIAEVWKSLDESEKRPYEDRAAKDRERVQKEKEKVSAQFTLKDEPKKGKPDAKKKIPPKAQLSKILLIF
jgi:hypothetical protein